MIIVIEVSMPVPFGSLTRKYDLVRSYCLGFSPFAVFGIRDILIIPSPSLPPLCVCTTICTLFLWSWWELNPEP